ncbi:MAG: hypothetical protein DRG39_01560 [Deltaproteobacteria bacterium]|nr:MAG: hypothetical protein DRG39_01560 [Deltaproteobacteria bacterium]
MHNKELSFIYTIAHELKAPIITIEGFLNALLKDFSHELPGDAKEYLSYMDSAVRRLKAVINDLLNLSKSSPDDNKREKFPIKDIINDVIIRMRPIIKQKGIKINIHQGLPLVYGNKKQIELVMENLISNAIKYIGRNNPDPKVDIGAREIDDKKVIFIKDNGIGIDKKYQDKVFDIFERTPAGKKESEGTGIGLFIVKNIIEGHGGKIWVESCKRGGSTFYIYLPEREEDGSIKDSDS